MSNPDIQQGAVIEYVQMDGDGNVAISYRADGVADSVVVPSESVTPSFLRRVRKWKREQTPVCLLDNREEGVFQISNQIPEGDHIGEALDTIQVIYIALQDVRTGLEILAGIAQQAVLMDPLRGVVNRYLR